MKKKSKRAEKSGVAVFTVSHDKEEKIMKYKDQFIWLLGNHGVFGIKVDELNDYIREYNNSNSYKFIDFWNWLKYEKDIDAHGFSALWNDKNQQMKNLISIKKAA